MCIFLKKLLNKITMYTSIKAFKETVVTIQDSKLMESPFKKK
jgi:hypothetical protein